MKQCQHPSLSRRAEAEPGPGLRWAWVSVRIGRQRAVPTITSSGRFRMGAWARQRPDRAWLARRGVRGESYSDSTGLFLLLPNYTRQGEVFNEPLAARRAGGGRGVEG